MKNVFIPLTEAIYMAKDGKNKPGRTAYINMSRVQEVWPGIYGGSQLVMNIPDAEVYVMESPDEVIQILGQCNAGGNDDGSR